MAGGSPVDASASSGSAPAAGRSAREWLDRQLRLLLTGGLVWLIGVGLESGLVRWLGVAVLAVALALRFPRRRAEREAKAGAGEGRR